MKETYQPAKMEIIEFETEDVITTSGLQSYDPNGLEFMRIEDYK